MNFELPEAILVKDAAQLLGVNTSLIYHWTKCGLLRAVKIRNPAFTGRHLVRIDRYVYQNKYGQIFKLKSRLLAIPRREFVWLLDVRDNAPGLLFQRHTKTLRMLKKSYYKIQ